MPIPDDCLPWRDAWQSALYGDDGFFRREAPADHFRTSVNASGQLAAALRRLVQSERLTEVVDIGAGRGELLADLHRLSGGSLRLTGVEVAERPGDLPEAIAWRTELPAHVDGLLIAHEWLDNVPCDVVEVDDDGTRRLVEVDPDSGEERLGDEAPHEWLDVWWPLAGPGERAEIGTSRDRAWADAVSRVSGIALAIDYGHVRDGRPPFGSLRSYLDGHEVDVVPDGSRDVTAHVAVDAVAAAAGAFGTVTMRRQNEALRSLGVSGTRPPLDLATRDPAAYVRALSSASQAAELLASGGLGDFWWICTDTRGPADRA